MGFVFHGVPPYMVNWGVEQLPGATAIETGTLLGDSALLLADAFGSCQTIEIDPGLAAKAAQRFESDSRIEVVSGSSRGVLEDCLRRLEQPPFIWLDAHWSRDLGTEPEDPCPLLFEIEVIGSVFGDRAAVLVDDARVFGAISPRDNVANAWPSLREVLSALEGIGLATFVLDDVAVGVPPSLRSSFAGLIEQSWTANAGTVDNFVTSVRRATPKPASKLRSGVRSTKAALLARLK